MSQRILYFLIPDIHEFISGGNLYNKELLHALKEVGQAVEIINFDELDLIKADDYLFVDTLYVHEFQRYQSTQYFKHFFLIVHHLESLYPPQGWTSPQFFKEKEFLFLKKFTGFLTSSQFTADYLQQNGIEQTKIIIPPALQYPPTHYQRTQQLPLQILMVANLIQRKGIYPFLQALNQQDLTLLKNKVKISLIGADNLESEYAQKCYDYLNQHKLLQNIFELKGEISPMEMPNYYQQATLFISTSFMETYGMAIQEAKAFKIPILALKGGNTANHIQIGTNGWLANDMANLVQQLFVLVENSSFLWKMKERLINSKQKVYLWKDAAKLFIEQLSQI